MVSLNDMADRAPRVLADGEVIDLGGKRVRYIDTPHMPHGWDAGVLYEETTGTLLCGDLFTQLGDGPALTEGDIVGPGDRRPRTCSSYSSLNPGMGATIRRLADARAEHARADARPLLHRRRRRRAPRSPPTTRSAPPAAAPRSRKPRRRPRNQTVSSGENQCPANRSA